MYSHCEYKVSIFRTLKVRQQTTLTSGSHNESHTHRITINNKNELYNFKFKKKIKEIKDHKS